MSLHNINTEIDRYIVWPGQVFSDFTQGRSQDFPRGGHRGYSPDCHVDLHAKILSWRPPEYCRLFAQKKTYQGGEGHCTESRLFPIHIL